MRRAVLGAAGKTMGVHAARKTGAILILVVLACPTGAAWAIQTTSTDCAVHVVPMISPCEPFLPCLHVSVTMHGDHGDPHVVEVLDACRYHYPITVTWSANPGWAEGSVHVRATQPPLVVQSSDVHVLGGGAAWAWTLPRALGIVPGSVATPVAVVADPSGPTPDQPPSVEREYAVEVRFRVEWAGACFDARGVSEALLGDERVRAGLVLDFAELCRLVTSVQADPDIDARDPFLRVARLLLAAAVPAAPGIDLASILARLDAAAPPPAAQAPGLVAEGDAGVRARPAAGDVDAHAMLRADVRADPIPDEPARPDAQPRADVASLDAALLHGRTIARELPESPADLPALLETSVPPAKPVAVAPAEPWAVQAHGASSEKLHAGGAPLLIAAGVAGALLVLGFAFYVRVTRPASLRHPARALLHEALRRHENGASAATLGSEVGLSRQNAEYHLRYLVRLGMVKVVEPPDGPRLFCLQATRAQASLEESLLQRIRERPGVSLAELAASLGVSRARVDWRVKGLVLAGAVTNARSEGERRLFPAA